MVSRVNKVGAGAAMVGIARAYLRPARVCADRNYPVAGAGELAGVVIMAASTAITRLCTTLQSLSI